MEARFTPVHGVPANAYPTAAFALERLRAASLLHAPREGVFRVQTLSRLEVSRFDRPHRNVQHGLYTPCVAVIAQGSKRIWLAEREWRYTPAQVLLYTLEVPVTGQVLRASADEPCLCVRLELDTVRLAELVLRMPISARAVQTQALMPAPAEPAVLEELARLLEACAAPAPHATLLPPVIEEALWLRLLVGPLGPALVQFVQAGSLLRRLQPALAHLRQHLERRVSVAELARLVHMSESNLHHQFKNVLGMSPLQYHKALRLQQARQLLAGRLDVSHVAERVGYVSAAQFSREYTRFFGYPPSREAMRIAKGELETI